MYFQHLLRKLILLSAFPQDIQVKQTMMISGAAESAELGRHGLCQVRKHDGKVFVSFFLI